MKSLRLLLCLGACFVLLGRFLSAQEPIGLLPPIALDDDSAPPSPTPIQAEQSGGDPSPAEPEPAQTLFPRDPPGMFGDLLEMESVRQSVGNQLTALPPLAFLSALQISDNESPRPLDRLFVTGNDFNTVSGVFLASNASSANVYREMIGFEKTFLQGNASIGMRLPNYQLAGAPGLNESQIGDVSVILKYAFINNRASGHALSGGLMVTAPTGTGLHLPGQSTLNPVFVQPWLGDLWAFKNLFLQGFTSIALPTDARAGALFFKSVGVGYWLYRANDPNRFLSAIVPDAELHLTDTSIHKGVTDLSLGIPVMLDFTGGVYVYLRRAVLGIGVGTPLTGPKPYEYLITTNLNFRF